MSEDKTTVYLDSDSYGSLKRIARRRGVSAASLVREAVAEYAARHDTVGRPRSIGGFASGRGDLGARAETLLRGFGGARRRGR
jgi:ribbon-helix-helix CopG family protein